MGPVGSHQGTSWSRMVPYWCTIDVRTHTGHSGVPTGPLGACRDPTGPRRTAGGTVGPRLIGASPVWAARSSYWRSRGYCQSFLSMGKTPTPLQWPCPCPAMLGHELLEPKLSYQRHQKALSSAWKPQVQADSVKSKQATRRLYPTFLHNPLCF